jgi:penicillin-binding protein-related factor A (putative recombinase)
VKRGAGLESYLDRLHANYRRRGLGHVVHVPTHVQITSNQRGKVTGTLRPPVWVDYTGVLQGGRGVAIEAKEARTDKPSFPLSAIRPVQMDTLALVDGLGGVAALYVRRMASLPHQDYFVPWSYIAALDRRSFRWDDVARYAVPAGKTWIDATGIDWQDFCQAGWE